MSAIMHRFLRLSAFVAGLVIGGLSVLFAFDNPSHITLAIGNWQFAGIPLWSIALAPLVAGIGAGYLYHFPARLHHFNEHMRHRGLAHDLRKENAELSRSLDRLLAMPNDDTPALAAAAAAINVTPVARVRDPAPVAIAESPTMPETVVVAAAPAAEVAEAAAQGDHNGRRLKRESRRSTPRAVVAPEAEKGVLKKAVVAAAAATQARAPRPKRRRRPAAEAAEPS